MNKVKAFALVAVSGALTSPAFADTPGTPTKSLISNLTSVISIEDVVTAIGTIGLSGIIVSVAIGTYIIIRKMTRNAIN